MIIDSKAYGKIGVDEKQIFHFKNGILGFENIKDFALLDAGQPPFMWLQSIEVSHLAFVVIDPTIFRKDYEAGISLEDLELIGITEDTLNKLLVLSIVTIPENQNDMTANLQGPIMLNKDKQLGNQYIAMDDRWGTRHHIMDELAGKRTATC